MTNPDMYAVEVEAGRSPPVPSYVTDWLLARWMGITRTDLLALPMRDVEEARIVMQAISDAEDAMRRKANG